MTRKKKWAIGCGVPVLLVALGLIVLPEQRKALITAFHLQQEGAFSHEEHDYDVKSHRSTLDSLYKLMVAHNESEGALPEAAHWMDAMAKRVKTADLKEGEELKKLQRPDLVGQASKYGYAINAEVSGKFLGDIKDKKTILIYESKQTVWNAVGDPKTDRQGAAITVSGEFVP